MTGAHFAPAEDARLDLLDLLGDAHPQVDRDTRRWESWHPVVDVVAPVGGDDAAWHLMGGECHGGVTGRGA